MIPSPQSLGLEASPPAIPGWASIAIVIAIVLLVFAWGVLGHIRSSPLANYFWSVVWRCAVIVLCLALINVAVLLYYGEPIEVDRLSVVRGLWSLITTFPDAAAWALRSGLAGDEELSPFFVAAFGACVGVLAPSLVRLSSRSRNDRTRLYESYLDLHLKAAEVPGRHAASDSRFELARARREARGFANDAVYEGALTEVERRLHADGKEATSDAYSVAPSPDDLEDLRLLLAASRNWLWPARVARLNAIADARRAVSESFSGAEPQVIYRALRKQRRHRMMRPGIGR